MGHLIRAIPLDYTDAVVALGAGMLGAIAGALGVFALLRGRSLVGDAVSHAALPGVCIAFLLTGVKDASGLLVGAAAAGFVAAALMVGIERAGRIRPDAAIGVVLSGFFSLGVVLLTYISNLNNASQAGLEKYLFGQAAGLQERDLTVMVVLAAASAACVAAGFRAFRTTLFDREFAASAGLPVRALELAMTALVVVAVVAGVRVVGAVLMVAMLVAPAAAARQLTDRLSYLVPLAAALGACIGAGGALAAGSAAVPTGPVIVLFGVGVAVLAVLLAPGRGVLANARRLRRERLRALMDGVLVDVVTARAAGTPAAATELAAATGRPRRAVARGLRALERAGLLAVRDGVVAVTRPGEAAAARLIERRELWSAWLEHGWTVDLPDAREPDPRDLRATLGDAAADRLLAAARGGAA
jgi:manganese/zinc/iron transport system permease protein